MKSAQFDLIGGAEEVRTPDLVIANDALCQTELQPHKVRRILMIEIYFFSVKFIRRFSKKLYCTVAGKSEPFGS